MRFFAHLIAIGALVQAAMSLTTKPPHGKYFLRPKKQQIDRTDLSFIDKRPPGHQPFCHWRYVKKWAHYQIWIPDGDRKSLGQSMEEFCQKMDMEVDAYTVCGIEHGPVGKGKCGRHKNGIIWERDAVRVCGPEHIEEAMHAATVPNTRIRCVGDEEIADRILDGTINPT